jgi:hypothetical protein
MSRNRTNTIRCYTSPIQVKNIVVGLAVGLVLLAAFAIKIAH